jgi:hypothetical protein
VPSRLARGQPRARDAVTTRPRQTSGGRRSHGSPECNLGRAARFRLARGRLGRCFRRCQLRRPTLRGGPTNQLCEADRPTNSAWQIGRPSPRRPTHRRASESARQGERLSPHRADPQGRNPDRRRRPTTAVTRHNDNKTRPSRTYQYQKASDRRDGTPPRVPTDKPALTHGAGQL